MRLSASALFIVGVLSASRVVRADEPVAPPSPPRESTPTQPASSSDEETTVYDDPEPIEVTVREAPRPAGTTSFTRAEVRSVPGAFGDAFRAIESAPSIVPLASGVPYFYVRGAPPGDVGYFLDGIRVPVLFHLGLGPSVVHPALIDSVELTPGPTPELGRFLGGAVAGTLTAPRENLRLEGNVRFVDAGAFIETPFDEGRGSAFAAGRVAYTALLFSLVNSDAVLNYWDYAGRVSYEVAPGQTLSLFGFGSYDYLAEKRETGPDERLVDTMFHRVDVGYDVRVSPRTSIEHDVILGWDQTHLGVDQNVLDQSLALRSIVKHRVNDDLELRAGFDVTIDDYVAELTEDQGEGFAAFFQSRTDLAAGGFLVLPMQASERLALLPGLRADVYASNGLHAFALDPTVSARLTLLPELALVTAHGLSSQTPSFIVAGPGFRPGLDAGGLQRAFSSSVGVEAKPGDDWSLAASVYRTAFFDINDALGSSALSGESFPEGFDQFNPRYDGTSIGLELSAKRRLSRAIGAILTYSLGRSERRDERGRVYPSGFDRTHVATAALSFDFGKGYKGGIRQLIYSGTPLFDVSGDELRVKGRLPPFYRLDWRVEKRFDIGETGFITMVLEALNTFLADEALGESCDERGRCELTTIGPIAIPSFGVEGGF